MALLLACASACSNGAEEAARAQAEAQAAIALGDLPAARDALVRAVQARDDVAEIWSTLGQVQLQLRNYSDAYYAYSRAVELDRGNAQALQVLGQIALLSDRLDEASRLADQLDVLEPGGVASTTIKGYIALKRGRYRDAIAGADSVLAKAPTDVGATVLKALALEGGGQPDPAVALLEGHLAANGQNQVILKNLLDINKRRLDGPGTVRALARLSALSPSDKALALEHVRALFEQGETARARSVSHDLMRSDPPPNVFAEVLKLWLGHLPRAEAVRDARALETSDRSRRLNLARFFIEAGAPDEAERLLADDARSPVNGASANAIAVLAHARAAQGRREEAERMFGEVLEFDATNIAALRGRTDLYLEAGELQAALSDAQRLVAENPQSPEDRLRLSEVYRRRGDKLLAERTLWQAFDDIPANPLLFASLRSFLRREERADAVATLERRYLQQRRETAPS